MSQRMHSSLSLSRGWCSNGVIINNKHRQNNQKKQHHHQQSAATIEAAREAAIIQRLRQERNKTRRKEKQYKSKEREEEMKCFFLTFKRNGGGGTCWLPILFAMKSFSVLDAFQPSSPRTTNSFHIFHGNDESRVHKVSSFASSLSTATTTSTSTTTTTTSSSSSTTATDSDEENDDLTLLSSSNQLKGLDQEYNKQQQEEEEEEEDVKSFFYIRSAVMADLGFVSRIMADGFHGNLSFIFKAWEQFQTQLSLEASLPKRQYDYYSSQRGLDSADSIEQSIRQQQQAQSQHDMFVVCHVDTHQVLAFGEVDNRQSRNQQQQRVQQSTILNDDDDENNVNVINGIPNKKNRILRPYMANLAVHLEWKRMGLATALIRHIENVVANTWKEPVLYLKVRQENYVARTLYDKLGYQFVSQEPDPKQKRQTLYVLKKQLVQQPQEENNNKESTSELFIKSNNNNNNNSTLLQQ